MRVVATLMRRLVRWADNRPAAEDRIMASDLTYAASRAGGHGPCWATSTLQLNGRQASFMNPPARVPSDRTPKLRLRSRLAAAAACAGSLMLCAVAAAEPAGEENTETTLGDFLLSAGKDAAAKKGKDILSSAGAKVLDMGLSYFGVNQLLSKPDPFAAHAVAIMDAIATASQQVRDHIDQRWEAQTHADLTAAFIALNQWRLNTLTARVKQVDGAMNLMNQFGQVLGRYEADIRDFRRLDLLHEYAIIADLTASLAVEYGQLSVLNSRTENLRASLTAQQVAQGNFWADASTEDALRVMAPSDRARLDNELRDRARAAIDALLLGQSAPGVKTPSNFLDVVASISANEITGMVRAWMVPIKIPGNASVRSDGRTQTDWTYDVLVDGERVTYGILEVSAGPPFCGQRSYEYYTSWDNWETNWAQSWMFPSCQRPNANAFGWGVSAANASHNLALAAEIYVPVRLMLEKWWELAGHNELRPYNDLDDLVDMYVMDFHAELGGDAIEAFAYTASDGSALQIDRSYSNPDWTPLSVWSRTIQTFDTRLPQGPRETNRALVDIALRYGPDALVDYLYAPIESDPLRTTPPTIRETIQYSRAGATPEEYAVVHRGAFAAKFAAIAPQ